MKESKQIETTAATRRFRGSTSALFPPSAIPTAEPYRKSKGLSRADFGVDPARCRVLWRVWVPSRSARGWCVVDRFSSWTESPRRRRCGRMFGAWVPRRAGVQTDRRRAVGASKWTDRGHSAAEDLRLCLLVAGADGHLASGQQAVAQIVKDLAKTGCGCAVVVVQLFFFRLKPDKNAETRRRAERASRRREAGGCIFYVLRKKRNVTKCYEM
jgi:hypothetical protein